MVFGVCCIVFGEKLLEYNLNLDLKLYLKFKLNFNLRLNSKLYFKLKLKFKFALELISACSLMVYNCVYQAYFFAGVTHFVFAVVFTVR